MLQAGLKSEIMLESVLSIPDIVNILRAVLNSNEKCRKQLVTVQVQHSKELLEQPNCLL